MGRIAPRITWIIISTTRVQSSLQTFGTIFGARKLFSKKIHPCGSSYIISTSACYVCLFFSPISPIFGTKLPKCRRYGITILYRGTKNSGRSSGNSKKYFYQYLLYFANPKTQIGGNFSQYCRYFLQHYYRDTFKESHRKPIEVPQISYSGRLTCSTPILIPTKREWLF